MKEYITKDRAKQFVCGHCTEACSEKPCESRDCDWMAFIDKEPAADVMEVVRCRECKHRGTDDCILHIKGEPADEELLLKLDNDFCSYGERKGGAN